MTFDPTLFVMNNQDLLTTVGVVALVGAFALAFTAVIIMLALRSDR
jgi:NADH:ubiquinone oxidoreductase subunit 6 (subunit J)